MSPEADEDDKILAKEVESSKGFEYALRKPNATLFSKMLKECLENEEYASAFKTKGPQYSTESLFMALIFQQQKMITELIKKLGSNQNNGLSNICERIYSKIVVGESHYFVGKKFCRRCECYFITKKIFCQCCGMQLRQAPQKENAKKK